MSDTSGPSCSEGDSARTGARTMGDAEGPEGTESKIDIITLDKTNKTPMLVSY